MNRILALLIIILTPLFFGWVVWTRNLFLWNNYCNASSDLGVTIEYIRKIIQGDNNPFSDILQIHQYNDKFTPILYILSKSISQYFDETSWFANLHQYLWLVELISLYLLVPFLLWETLRGKISLVSAAICTSMFFLSINLFQVVSNPGHPYVWGLSVLIMMGWTAAQLSDNKTVPLRFHFALFLGYFYLCLLDAQYSLIGLTLGLAFLFFTRDRVKGLLWIFWGTFWIWIALIGRKMAVGPLNPYFDFQFKGNWHEWLIRFIPFVPILIYLIKKPKSVFKSSLRPYFVIFLVYIPLLNGPYIGLIILSFLTTLILFFFKKQKVQLIYAGVSFVFFLSLSALETYKVFIPKYKTENISCVSLSTTNEKLELRTKKIKELLRIIQIELNQNNQKVLASTGMVSNLLVEFPKIRVFEFAKQKTKSVDSFDLMILEKWQASEKLILAIKEYGLSVLINDEDLFVVQGRIPYSLIESFIEMKPGIE